MIFDSLDHIDVYKNTHPGLYRGLKLLAETDFSQLEDRWHEVDGKELYFLLQTYETQPDNPTPRDPRSVHRHSVPALRGGGTGGRPAGGND